MSAYLAALAAAEHVRAEAFYAAQDSPAMSITNLVRLRRAADAAEDAYGQAQSDDTWMAWRIAEQAYRDALAARKVPGALAHTTAEAKGERA